MQITEQTKALANDIIDYWMITGSHQQSDWVEDLDPKFHVEEVNGKQMDVCDTTMCAAGTAVFLSNSVADFKQIVNDNGCDERYWEEEGARLLGLDEYEARRLFYSNNEPAFSMMIALANGDEEKFFEVKHSYE